MEPHCQHDDRIAVHPQVKRAGFSGGNIDLEGGEGVGDGDAVPGDGGAGTA